jgi:hypothetical protein
MGGETSPAGPSDAGSNNEHVFAHGTGRARQPDGPGELRASWRTGETYPPPAAAQPATVRRASAIPIRGR